MIFIYIFLSQITVPSKKFIKIYVYGTPFLMKWPHSEFQCMPGHLIIEAIPEEKVHPWTVDCGLWSVSLYES